MNFFWIYLKGLAMGAADVVPGVSGGTVAYLTGIYQRLLNAIHGIGPEAVKAWKIDGLRGVWRAVDGTFLLALFLGIATSILSLSKGVLWALDHYPSMLWGLFFGLILGSLPLVVKDIPKKRAWKAVPFGLIGLASGVLLAMATPANVQITHGYIFLCGAVAICAMILPGISGSFILVLLGTYEIILDGLHARDWAMIVVFSLGAGIGLLSFGRFLRWLFGRFPASMMATMAGFIAGSLLKIWPFQHFEDPNNLWVIASVSTGWLLVYGIQRWAKSLHSS